jgi:hypothetical protein
MRKTAAGLWLLASSRTTRTLTVDQRNYDSFEIAPHRSSISQQFI